MLLVQVKPNDKVFVSYDNYYCLIEVSVADQTHKVRYLSQEGLKVVVDKDEIMYISKDNEISWAYSSLRKGKVNKGHDLIKELLVYVDAERKSKTITSFVEGREVSFSTLLEFWTKCVAEHIPVRVKLSSNKISLCVQKKVDKPSGINQTLKISRESEVIR